MIRFQEAILLHLGNWRKPSPLGEDFSRLVADVKAAAFSLHQFP